MKHRPRILGREAPDPQFLVQKHRGDFRAVQQILQVVVRGFQFIQLVLQFRVHRHQLFVERLQLLLRGFQFLVGALQLFVGRLHLLVRGLELLVRQLQFLDRPLQALLGVLQIEDQPDLRALRLLDMHVRWAGGRDRFGFKRHQQESFEGFRLGDRRHGNGHAERRAMNRQADALPHDRAFLLLRKMQGGD